MNRTIALANHKGGVAKTSSTLNIGAILATMGKRVLLIDLDSQANLTTSLLREEPEITIYNALLGEVEALPIVNIRESLDIVPSSELMATIDLQIANKMDREYILKDLLSNVADNYDYVLLDCPPSLGLITLNALVASTELYIPLTAEAYPTKGLKMIADNIGAIQKRANKALRLSGIIITRWEGTNLNQKTEEALRRAYGSVVFSTKIRKNVAIAESPLSLTDVATYDNRSNGAKDYTALCKEIVARETK